MATKVAQAVADGMRQAGYSRVGWGDCCLVDFAGDLVKVKRPHPMNVMRAIMAHLDRSPDLFEKRYRISGNLRGAEVRVRTYKLLEASNAE